MSLRAIASAVAVIACLLAAPAALAKSQPWKPGTYVGAGLTFKVTKSTVSLVGGSVTAKCYYGEGARTFALGPWKPVKIKTYLFSAGPHKRPFRAGEWNGQFNYSGQDVYGSFTAGDTFTAVSPRLRGSSFRAWLSVTRSWKGTPTEDNPYPDSVDCSFEREFTAKRQ